MSSVVCTLFEGHYDKGVAALANSLYRHGFRGALWIGHRGPLPSWAQPLQERDGSQFFEPASGLRLHFQKVETKRHLTNYKPDFIAGLRRLHFPEADQIYYFDPDIVVKTGWEFFEKWTAAGVALCEDVNSPMHSTHPIRTMWHRFFEPQGFAIARELDVYVNAGFVGVSRENWDFIELWQRLLSLMESETNGLSELGVKDRAYPFHKPDQDALNAAAMYAARAVSIAGKDAMDFIHGGFLMSHALGNPKPWRKAFIRETLRGYPPAQADHNFWQHTEQPINIFTEGERRRKKLELAIASGLGRFYARN